MKTTKILLTLSTLLLSSFTSPINKADTSFDGKAYDSSQMVDFSDSTFDEATNKIKSNMDAFRQGGEYKIHLNSYSYTLDLELSPDDEIVVSYDDTIVKLDQDDKAKIHPLKIGSCELKYDFINSGVSYKTTLTVVDKLTATVKDENGNIINDGDTLTVENPESDKYKLVVDAPNKFDDESYGLSSSNHKVVDRSNDADDELEFFKKGYSTISVSMYTKAKQDHRSHTDLLSFKMVIRSFKRSLDWSAYFIIGVVALYTIIIIAVIVRAIVNAVLRNREHRV